MSPHAAIPAQAGIQKRYWIPGQARNDRLGFNIAILIIALVYGFAGLFGQAGQTRY